MNPTAVLLQPEIAELIRSGRYSELRAILHELPPADVADIFAQLEPAETAVGFRFLPRDDAALVFSYLAPEKQEELIHELGAEQALRVVEAMEPDDRVALLDELPPEVAQRLIGSLSPESRRVTQAILGYPPESVGRRMTPDYVRVRPEWSVAQALDHVRRYGRDAETINVVYIVDEQGRLVDDLRLRTLLLADPAAGVESLMTRNFIALRADQDQEEAVRMLARYDRIAMPVVDSRGVLVGIITADDVADVAEEETTEDIQKLGGVEALDEPYMQAGLAEMFRKRGFWLTALFAGQTVTVFVLGAFQEQLSKALALTLFIPLVISCGGNSGSQAATLVTRALALGEVRIQDWLRVMRREVGTGLALGVALGALGLFVSLFWHAVGVAHTTHPARLAITIGLAVLSVVLWGTTLGSTLPILLKRVGLDPAVASTPLVATLMDASGMILYFLIAILLLRGTLL